MGLENTADATDVLTFCVQSCDVLLFTKHAGKLIQIVYIILLDEGIRGISTTHLF